MTESLMTVNTSIPAVEEPVVVENFQPVDSGGGAFGVYTLSMITIYYFIANMVFKRRRTFVKKGVLLILNTTKLVELLNKRHVKY